MAERKGLSPVLWSSCMAVLGVGANSTAIMAALPSMQGLTRRTVASQRGPAAGTRRA